MPVNAAPSAVQRKLTGVTGENLDGMLAPTGLLKSYGNTIRFLACGACGAPNAQRQGSSLEPVGNHMIHQCADLVYFPPEVGLLDGKCVHYTPPFVGCVL